MLDEKILLQFGEKLRGTRGLKEREPGGFGFKRWF